MSAFMRMITLIAKVVFLAGSFQHGQPFHLVFPAGIHGKSLCRDESWPLSMSSLAAVYGSVSSEPLGSQGVEQRCGLCSLCLWNQAPWTPQRTGPWFRPPGLIWQFRSGEGKERSWDFHPALISHKLKASLPWPLFFIAPTMIQRSLFSLGFSRVLLQVSWPYVSCCDSPIFFLLTFLHRMWARPLFLPLAPSSFKWHSLFLCGMIYSFPWAVRDRIGHSMRSPTEQLLNQSASLPLILPPFS